MTVLYFDRARHVEGLKWEAVDAKRARLLDIRDLESRAADALGLSFVHVRAPY